MINEAGLVHVVIAEGQTGVTSVVTCGDQGLMAGGVRKHPGIADDQLIVLEADVAPLQSRYTRTKTRTVHALWQAKVISEPTRCVALISEMEANSKQKQYRMLNLFVINWIFEKTKDSI
jgi:hypothetical protein